LQDLRGLSGSPVYDWRTRKVTAIVQSFSPVVENSGSVVYAAPISEFERIFARTDRGISRFAAMASLALAVVVALAAILMLTDIPLAAEWWLWPPSAQITHESYTKQPDGGRIHLSGASKNVFGSSRRMLLFVNPEHDYTHDWFLQREGNGIWNVTEDGAWEGRAQLGSAGYPPNDGDRYSLAVVIVSDADAKEITTEAVRNGGKLAWLEPSSWTRTVLVSRDHRFKKPATDEATDTDTQARDLQVSGG
jgi:hypothetical protein